MIAQDIIWPGGEHPFRLGLAELEAVQQKTDAGPEWLLLRLRSGQWAAADVFEVMRYGLVGGGMDNAAALKLVRDVFDRHPLIDFKVPAMAVLMAALYGPSDDPAGKDLPAGETTPIEPSAGDGSLALSTP